MSSDDLYDPFQALADEKARDASLGDLGKTLPAPDVPARPKVDRSVEEAVRGADPVSVHGARVAGLAATIDHTLSELRYESDSVRATAMRAEIKAHQAELAQLVARPPKSLAEDPFQNVPPTAPDPARRKAT